MRIVALKHKALAVLAALVALSALGGPSTASAAGTIITPTPPLYTFTQSAWYPSGVTLAEDVQGTPSDNSFKISDRSLLREGWMIQVGTEYMLIEFLFDGAVHQPDVMVVQRAMNGSGAVFHASGKTINAQTVTVNIYANNVTNSWGLGGFEVGITLPPEVQFIKMTSQSTWLTSTGRSEWCDGPFQYGDTWTVSCATTGNLEDGRYPIGPKGSGVIATVTVLPPQNPGLSTVSLAGQLVNTPGDVIPATVNNLGIRVLKCPDANLDGSVNVGDALIVAIHADDEGEDSGATLVSQVDASQTNMQVSDQSLLLSIPPYNCSELPCTISIDAELMTLQALQEGTPDTMTVARKINNTKAKPHNAGAHIYRGTYDGNYDGKYGYTGPRDVNSDGYINVGDALIIARASDIECPAP